jgi:5-methyltetrahydrofolate--homocysteine methyltransferase
LKTYVELPIMISAPSPTPLVAPSRQTTEAFWNSVNHAKPISVGAELRPGRKDQRPYLEELSAGHPHLRPPQRRPANAFGGDETPAEMAVVVEEFAASNFLNIIGAAAARQHIGRLPAVSKYHRGSFQKSLKPAACRVLSPSPSTQLAVYQRWRAHQHHRLGALRPADPRLHRSLEVACSRWQPALR